MHETRLHYVKGFKMTQVIHPRKEYVYPMYCIHFQSILPQTSPLTLKPEPRLMFVFFYITYTKPKVHSRMLGI